MSQSITIRPIELLAPAANKEVARQAILHGADAVYIGASSHGARHNAGNSIDDIREVVEFAHQFHVRVYVTVNTLVYDSEILQVERLIRDLYRVGVDAIIVQDMGILGMNIPPIQLHASTQCDTRTPEKALFLEKSGFSQIVLARELSIEEIQKICRAVTVPVEVFVHGALCVSYSGRCQASEKCLKRSANRGECSQMCRLPYSLINGKGEKIITDKYLLSLSDFNASARIAELMEVGVSSFKIEGRLKDAGYVKNVTAAYRKIIDDVIAANPDKYCRASKGTSHIKFTPNLNKSFNRGFTEYFLSGRRNIQMASLFTPKSLGEEIVSIADLNNGDGISYINPYTGSYEGVRINRVDGNKILTSNSTRIPAGAKLRRTYDREWDALMASETAMRKIQVDIELDPTGISASDERGNEVRIPLDCTLDKAKKSMDFKKVFEKTGGTIYELNKFTCNLPLDTFIPMSQLTARRRELLAQLDLANKTNYSYEYRKLEEKDYQYPADRLESRDNVANSLASEFYIVHGVKKIDKALEVLNKEERKRHSDPVMTSRYCIRRELGCCKKNPKPGKLTSRLTEPLRIQSGPNTFRLEFDCKKCEMNIY